MTPPAPGAVAPPAGPLAGACVHPRVSAPLSSAPAAAPLRLAHTLGNIGIHEGGVVAASSAANRVHDGGAVAASTAVTRRLARSSLDRKRRRRPLRRLVHLRPTRRGGLYGGQTTFFARTPEETARLLRALGHGGRRLYATGFFTAGVFKHFEKDGEFVCYPGQSNQSVTAMYNLYRAAQVAFPSEDWLYRANIYCRAFLEERRASGKFKDKWVIPKDLPGEVSCALDLPWRASLPRIETRMYLEQYGGSADVWIGKVLYRMPLFSNDLWLEMARADFHSFQRLCRLEWNDLRKWYNRNNLQVCGVTPESTLRAYFLAASNIFEPDRAVERVGWARTAVLAQVISWYLQCNSCTDKKRKGLISALENYGRSEPTSGEYDSTEKALLCALHELIVLPASDDASNGLCEAWKQWLKSCTVKESHESCEGNTALLLVRTIEICSGRQDLNEQNMKRFEYSQLEHLTASVCGKLATRVLSQNGANMENTENSDLQAELEMQELAQCVLQNCHSINRMTRETFLHVTKSYYYVAYCSPETIDSHISKVIFEDVLE